METAIVILALWCIFTHVSNQIRFARMQKQIDENRSCGRRHKKGGNNRHG